MTLAPIVLVLAVFAVLILGYPVAISLAGTALLAAAIGIFFGTFDPAFLSATPSRIFGIISNQTLVAVPLFVLMGVTLEKTKLAEQLLNTMGRVFGDLPGGLGISVTVVGMLMAASTGIVGATVVTMGLMALPIMLKSKYHVPLAAGTICATGTLGQIIPPSIALVLLGDVLSNAYQQAQLSQGIFNTKSVSVGDLFAGALIPGLLLVLLYLLYIILVSVSKPKLAPAIEDQKSVTGRDFFASVFPPLFLIFAVLGSILAGVATPTEAAGVGALGAIMLAFLKNELNVNNLREISISTTKTTSMVFFILIGASLFSLVFRGYGGEELIEHWFSLIPGGSTGALIIVMLVIFLLGFILDFIEITFIVVPIVGPGLLALGVDPIWLGIMIAVNLQTSFLTPPFGFALFYLRGVAPNQVETKDIYKGVAPFVFIQLILLFLLAFNPRLATWLPEILYG
ncbi:MAG: TRAP transporter large permease subunit [Pseudomonadota bacterium]|nr:TRAP transporter large permease subunit [Pseudomonadota bacterium]